MIISFKCKESAKIWEGKFSKKLPQNIQKIARRKLRMLNNSTSINDLKLPPSNRLEQLTGDKKGFYSIKINDQYRICFKWSNRHGHDVHITDYH